MWCAEPCKTQPSPFRAHKKHLHGQGFCVERGDTDRQGFIPAWSPSEAGRAYYKGWRVCSSLDNLYTLIQAATGRSLQLCKV